jgi:hypothetical protein
VLWHVCDVCRILDGDLRIKPCTFCGLCGAWICIEDIDNWWRRLAAGLMR